MRKRSAQVALRLPSRSALQRWIAWLLHPGSRLSHRALNAGVWATALRVVDQVFGLVRIAILARLLAPGDFGLMGIAALMMGLLDTFTNVGFSGALVQRRGDIRPYLDTAWTVAILRSLTLAFVLVLSAPLVADFFNAPEAQVIIQVMSVAVLLSGFRNIGIVHFERDLEFNKRFVYQIGGTLSNLAVAIPAALILRNAWALVFGSLGAGLALLILSYLLHPYRPRLRLEWGRAKDLYKFGFWVSSGSVLAYLVLNLSEITVGRVLGVAALGLYRIAFHWSNLPAIEMSKAIGSVAFPLYSRIQSDLTSLRRAHFYTLEVTVLVILPIAAMLAFLAPLFTEVVLGEQWLAAVPAMQLLVVLGVTRGLGASFGSLVQGVGKPHLATIFLFLMAVFTGSAIIPFIKLWGLVGAAAAPVLAGGTVQLFRFVVTARVLECSIWSVLSCLTHAVVATGTTMGVLYLVTLALPEWIPAIRLAILVLGGGSLYLVTALYVLPRLAGHSVTSMIATLVRGEPAGVTLEKI